MRTRAVDQNKLDLPLKSGHCRAQALVVDVLTRPQAFLGNIRKFAIDRAGQLKPLRRHEVPAIIDVSPKAALAKVQIQNADDMVHSNKGGRNMHRDSGLARATLLVTDNNYMGHRSSLWLWRACSAD